MHKRLKVRVSSLSSSSTIIKLPLLDFNLHLGFRCRTNTQTQPFVPTLRHLTTAFPNRYSGIDFHQIEFQKERRTADQQVLNRLNKTLVCVLKKVYFPAFSRIFSRDEGSSHGRVRQTKRKRLLWHLVTWTHSLESLLFLLFFPSPQAIPSPHLKHSRLNCLLQRC